MRTNQPRIPPLDDAELDTDQAALLQPYRNERGVLNIYRTLARQPRAARGILGWGRYVLRESDFDARLRELVILRVGWLRKSGYEWTQHSRLARGLGISAVEIERIKHGGAAEGWSELESLTLRAVDELHANFHLSDATWRELREWLSEKHVMDFVFTVGHYTQICMILNSFGIQVEAGQVVDDSLRTK